MNKPTWLEQVSGSHDGLEKFQTVSDFVAHFHALQAKLSESIVLPKGATVQDFRAASGQVPKAAAAYETQADADFEKPLKEVAFKRGYTHAEYAQYVTDKIQQRDDAAKQLKELQSSLKIDDAKITEAKTAFDERIAGLPDDVKTQLSADPKYFLLQLAGSEQNGADDTDKLNVGAKGTSKKEPAPTSYGDLSLQQLAEAGANK